MSDTSDDDTSADDIADDDCGSGTRGAGGIAIGQAICSGQVLDSALKAPLVVAELLEAADPAQHRVDLAGVAAHGCSRRVGELRGGCRSSPRRARSKIVANFFLKARCRLFLVRRRPSGQLLGGGRGKSKPPRAKFEEVRQWAEGNCRLPFEARGDDKDAKEQNRLAQSLLQLRKASQTSLGSELGVDLEVLVKKASTDPAWIAADLEARAAVKQRRIEGSALGASSGALGKSSGALGKSSGALGESSGALGASSGALGASSGALGASSGARGAEAAASHYVRLRAAQFENELAPWVAMHERLPRRQSFSQAQEQEHDEHATALERRVDEDLLARKLERLEKHAPKLADHIQGKLSEWRHREQRAEQADYKLRAQDLEDFIAAYGWPCYVKRPANDKQERELRLWRFVIKYRNACVPWQQEVLRELAAARPQGSEVERIFANWSLRASIPDPPRGGPAPVEPSPPSGCEDEDVEEAAEEQPRTERSSDNRAAYLRVHACKGLADALRDALDRNLPLWNENKAVGPELFCLIQSDWAVRQACPPGVSFSDCRVYVRHYVCAGLADVRTSKSFHTDEGLAVETMESLLSAALAEGCEPARRLSAIRALRRYCSARLEEHRRCHPSYYGELETDAFWKRKLYAIMDFGVLKSARCCCDLGCKVRVALRSDGVPHRVRVSVLPELEEGCKHLSAQDSETLRAERRECSMARTADSTARARHGFRLVPLASDFCCEKCQRQLHDVNVEELTCQEAKEWSARMQCVNFDGDAEAMRRHLREEQARLRKRSAIMVAAADAVRVGGQAHLAAFERFCGTDWDVFERSVVEKAILPAQRGTLEPDLLQVSYVEQQYRARCFGIRVDAVTGDRWSPAVPTAESPVMWSQYLGEWGFCSERLWCLRAWACAVGDIYEMHRDLQIELVDGERRVNSLYSFVDTGTEWVHVDNFHPYGGSLPDAADWRVICAQLLDRADGSAAVFGARFKLCRLLLDSDIEYNFSIHKFQFASRALHHVRNDKFLRAQFLQRANKDFKRFRGWSIQGWSQNLFPGARAADGVENGDRCGSGGWMDGGGGAGEEESCTAGRLLGGCEWYCVTEPEGGADKLSIVDDDPATTSQALPRATAGESDAHRNMRDSFSDGTGGKTSGALSRVFAFLDSGRDEDMFGGDMFGESSSGSGRSDADGESEGDAGDYCMDEDCGSEGSDDGI